MKAFPELIKYTMYYDSLTNDMIFLEAWDENEIIYYDEFPIYNFVRKQIGYSLMDFLYIDFDTIMESLKQIMTNPNNYNFDTISDYLSNLTETHPYFGFYLLDFHQFMEKNDFDEIDSYEILTIIEKDLKDASYYCNNIIRPFLEKCINSTSYEYLYSNYIEKQRLDRFLRNGELLDYNFYYKTTFESISSCTSEPLDMYSFYKTQFATYVEENLEKLEREYEIAKNGIHDIEDIYEYGYPYKSFEDEINTQNGILPKNFFMQNQFINYIECNKEELYNKYYDFISTKNFQFVDSITIDEGNYVSVINCIIFELTSLLKKHCRINICQNCGKLFPILGDYNAKYCERTTNNLTCKVIANRNSTKAKIQDVPAMKVYMKYYKRYKGRVRIMKISEADFELWNQQAKELRDDCINSLISLNEFEHWLTVYEQEHLS